jgi:hypothetical protein
MGRRINQTIGEAYLRNIATVTYLQGVDACKYMGVDRPWANNVPFKSCRPVLGMSDEQIERYLAGEDEIMNRLTERPHLFSDILNDIAHTLRRQKKWSRLAASPLGCYLVL